MNQPFSGSIVPSNYFQKDKRVFSVMIEVNRRLYMDETTGEKSVSYGECLSRLDEVIRGIRRWTPHP